MRQNFQEARHTGAHMAGINNSFLEAKRKAAEAAEERKFEAEVFREISRLAAGPSSAFEVCLTGISSCSARHPAQRA